MRAVMIATYPNQSEICMDMRGELHPRFLRLREGISEWTFAALYVFREAYQYRIAALGADRLVVSGHDRGRRFFMLPFGLPGEDVLDQLFEHRGTLRAASESQARELGEMGYEPVEDRDDFDYLYARLDLATLPGRKFHKKRNLVRAFLANHSCEARTLRPENRADALEVLEAWKTQSGEAGDYSAARQALDRMDELELSGGIAYVERNPVAYCLGEPLQEGRSFAIHFEKAIAAGKYRGVYQYLNQAFASMLPETCETINREEDLGDPGLRQAKESYYPSGFVKKYRVGARRGILPIALGTSRDSRRVEGRTPHGT